MKMLGDNQLNILESMANHEVLNYVWPGLTSYLIGGDGYGKVRMFVNSRNQHTGITPHSHRFDFLCLVLEGYVINRIWGEVDSAHGDDYYVSTLVYEGEIGKHKVIPTKHASYIYTDHRYSAGQFYSMTSKQIHSIEFSPTATVLFFEGPTVCDKSLILEPFVDGQVIPTYEVKGWMFQDGAI